MIILIIINKNYLYLFKKLKREYIYPVKQGIYLAFDIDTLEYLGIEMFYLAPITIQDVCDNKLNRLLSLGVLEKRYD